MKTTQCTLCGHSFGIEEETDLGQHLLCPYCNGKFSYLVDSAEFSTERLTYAIAECRKNEEDRLYYDEAPAGARLYIGLVFYGKVFKDHIDRDLYIVEMAEIETELKERDWSYLLEHESDPELAEYFRSKLPDDAGTLPKRKSHNDFHGKPKLGIIRSRAASTNAEAQEPVQEESDHAEPVQPKPVQPKPVRKNPTGKSSHFIVAAGLIGVVLVGIILHLIISEGSENSKDTTSVVAEREAAENAKAKRELQDTVSKRLTELNNRHEQLAASIAEVRANKNQFMVELNRAIEKGNIRAAELLTKDVARLNGAETAMAVLKEPFFNAFAIRYCGDKPFQKAENCRQKIQQVLDSTRELTKEKMDAINQLAIAYQENAVGEVRRAINEKYNSLVAQRKELSTVLQNLRQEQVAIPHLEGKKEIREKKESLDRLFQTDAFTAECGLVDIATVLSAPASTEDVFSLATRVKKEPTDNATVGNDARYVATLDPQAIPERDKRTSSDLMREKEKASSED